jgi:hypothetical protein
VPRGKRGSPTSRHRVKQTLDRGGLAWIDDQLASVAKALARPARTQRAVRRGPRPGLSAVPRAGRWLRRLRLLVPRQRVTESAERADQALEDQRQVGW